MLPRESPGMRIDHGGDILVEYARLFIEMGGGKSRKTFATRDNHADCHDTHEKDERTYGRKSSRADPKTSGRIPALRSFVPTSSTKRSGDIRLRAAISWRRRAETVRPPTPCKKTRAEFAKSKWSRVRTSEPASMCRLKPLHEGMSQNKYLWEMVTHGTKKGK